MIESAERPAEGVCAHCGACFAYRPSKRHCSPACRKAASQKAKRRVSPVNADRSNEERWRQHRDFELADRLAEMLYTLPTAGERLQFVSDVVNLARSGECARLRRILTLPMLIRPDPNKRWLFWRRDPNYCTFPQAADRFCRASAWRASVVDVVRCNVPEPETGEVVEDAKAA